VNLNSDWCIDYVNSFSMTSLPSRQPNSTEITGSRKEEMRLHETQRDTIKAAKRGENVFITGSGGTGKSFTMKKIIVHFRSIYSCDEWAIVASTGIAAASF
jgi:Cdc6-like AAA superfamily ATPase